ncbi:unnamed protein product [Caenorhabditis auriculariae]|uniref:Transmembrane protein n=1 Tax=Caenorhabditis auriculariae TaxID=2777116 RepID=A0A8S1GRR8_9PELO|nr:unnamed protein product [Caenorhabditis auriculariae]
MARSLLLRGLVRRVLLLRLNWLLSFNNWPIQTRTWLISFSRSLPWLNLLVLFKRHWPSVLLLPPLNLWLFQPQLLKLRPFLLWSLMLVSALVLALVFMLALVVSLALWLLLLTVVLLQPLFHILAVPLSCLVVLKLSILSLKRRLLFQFHFLVVPLSCLVVLTMSILSLKRRLRAQNLIFVSDSAKFF